MFIHKLKSYIKSLITTCVLFAYSTHCFAVIIIDVDICSKHLSYTANYTTRGTNKSIRVLSYDSDLNKIKFITYHPLGHNQPSFRHEYEDFFIEYHSHTNSLETTPKPNTTHWIRSSGRINSVHTESLDVLDETRTGFSILRQSPVPGYSSTMENTETFLNSFDLPAQAKKAPKGQKQWKKGHTQFNIAYAFENQQFYPIIWENLDGKELGYIGELACDLTMMVLGFVKYDVKHGGDKGIDGIYRKNDIVVAAESKMHENPVLLDAIDRDSLTPKFNKASNGAIVKLEAEKPEIYANILHAHANNKLYTLPFGVLPDGTAYMRINQRKDLISHPLASTTITHTFQSLHQEGITSFVTPTKDKDDQEILTSGELVRQLDKMSEEEIEKALPHLQNLFKKMNIQPTPRKEVEDEYAHQEFLTELYDYLRTTTPHETCDTQMINESFEVIRNIYENSIERSGNVSVINLEGARLFKEALLVNTTLKELSLHDIDGDKLTILQVALYENLNLSLKTLSIWGSLTDECMADFSRGIRSCTSLQTLNLKACSLSDEGISYLAEALCIENHSLKKIDLSLNKIGLEGAKALAEMIKANPNLREIYLHGNSDIGQAGVDLLIKSMGSNCQLDITLMGCH